MQMICVITAPMLPAVIMGARTKGDGQQRVQHDGHSKDHGLIDAEDGRHLGGQLGDGLVVLSLLEKRKMATIRPMVLPQPPMVTYVFQNV